MVLAVVPSLDGHEGLASRHHLQVGQPYIGHVGLAGLLAQQRLHMAEQQQLAGQRRPVAALVVELCRVVYQVALPCHVGGIGLHGLVAGHESEGIGNVDVQHGFVAVGVGKVDGIAVAYIHLIYIGLHGLELLHVGGHEAGMRGGLQQVERLEERGGGTVPVVGAFVAAAVGRVGIHERFAGFHYLAESVVAARLVVLAEQDARQPVAAYPGIPVHAGGLPPVFVFHRRGQYASAHLLVDALGEQRREAVQLVGQHIAGVGHERRRLGIEQIYRLVFAARQLGLVVGGQSPPGLFHHALQAVDDGGQEAALPLGYLAHHQGGQLATLAEQLLFVVDAVARFLVFGKHRGGQAAPPPGGILFGIFHVAPAHRLRQGVAPIVVAPPRGQHRAGVGYGGHTPHHHGQQKAVYRLRHQDMALFFKWSVTVVRFLNAKLVKT